MNIPQSRKHEWMKRLGWQFIPFGKVVVRFIDDLPRDIIAGPNYYRVARFNEAYSQQIDIKNKVVPLKVRDVRTKDGILIKVDATMTFKFDPRQAKADICATFAMQPSEIWEKVAKRQAEQVVRLVLGCYTSHEVRQGDLFTQWHRELRILIQQNESCRALGLLFATHDPIFINYAQFPAHIETESHLTWGLGKKTEAFLHQSPEQITALLCAEFIEAVKLSGGSVNVIASELRPFLPTNYSDSVPAPIIDMPPIRPSATGD